ncbi:threonine/serine dehydratase [Longispora albida]|uniref:threonine/serine dehydratase n=1 Tax=Longispora albida TaxID=203523 RepID=UPI00038121D3|nr:threonine/serine dehydratase [Longispora albida]
MIDGGEIDAAERRISGRIRRTPVAEAGADRWFKLEYLQHTGSFKARGMFNRILAAAERGELTAEGVIAASGGNAGLAVAYAARELGVPATVYVPRTAPEVKVAKLRALGATVVQEGSEYAEAYDAAIKQAADGSRLFCHAYDQPDLVAGHATLGLELLEQIPGGFDTVLVAVGGGGLMAGVASALYGHAQVIAVEPVTIPTLHSALSAGRPVDIEVSGIAADSLGARRVGDIAFETARAASVGSVLVSDDDIIAARRELWEDWRVLVEHGTAAAHAALISGAYRPADGERVVTLLCGANTNPASL